MKKIDGVYMLSDEKEHLDAYAIKELLSTTYWAAERSVEDIDLSVKNSHCFSLFHEERLVGFARVVTDDVSVYWLCDVVVDGNYRGKGLGKLLLDFVFEDHEFRGLGILITKDAHGLYEQFRYALNRENFMIRSN